MVDKLGKKLFYFRFVIKIYICFVSYQLSVSSKSDTICLIMGHKIADIEKSPLEMSVYI